MTRGQSAVVGVAVLVAATVVAVAALTASVGTVVTEHAAAADSRRVAADLRTALHPARTTGPTTGRVAFARGRLALQPRDVRVLNETGPVATVHANALRFSTGRHTVTYLAGGVLTSATARTTWDAPVAVRADADSLVVGVPALRGSVSIAAGRTARGGGAARWTLRSTVTHRRRRLGAGRYRIAIETTHTDAVSARLAAAGATATTVRAFDDDGVPSVVAAIPGRPTGTLLVHETRVSVS
ncbi:archaellin/type IV pilin N-terminal domain-containing protein [Halobacterium salinarum]|uniref:DUF7289 family protein n=1 Tax=Halobacterium salinarum TaxID=2242 RepID=UPI0030D18BB6